MPATSTAALRKEIRELVWRVPESELYAAKRFIESLAAQREPIPEDDEPFTEEQREAVARARKGRFVSHEDAKKRLGMT